MSLDQNAAAAPATDHRVRNISPIRKALIRPELGAICGTIAVFLFFLAVAPEFGMFSLEGVMNWGTVAAQFAIIAVGACLLMIAGEFDLSVGSMIGFTGIVIALLTTTFGVPLWLSILVAFAAALAIGAINGILILRTGLPSFIVTLAALFILRGLTIYIPISTNGSTIIGGLKTAARHDWLAPLFGGKAFSGVFAWLAEHGVIATFAKGPKAGLPVVDGVPMLMIWALILVVVGQALLTRTTFGNWIFAAGGDSNAARNVGVPWRVKSSCSCSRPSAPPCLRRARCSSSARRPPIAACSRSSRRSSPSSSAGRCSPADTEPVIGAALGALIFGVVQQGLFFAGVESSLFRVFLGVILLLAVILNTYIRRIITGER